MALFLLSLFICSLCTGNFFFQGVFVWFIYLHFLYSMAYTRIYSFLLLLYIPKFLVFFLTKIFYILSNILFLLQKVLSLFFLLSPHQSVCLSVCTVPFHPFPILSLHFHLFHSFPPCFHFLSSPNISYFPVSPYPPSSHHYASYLCVSQDLISLFFECEPGVFIFLLTWL